MVNNKEIGELELNNREVDCKSSKIMNPNFAAELFTPYFVETEQNSEAYEMYQATQLKLKTCSETTFSRPILKD